MKKVIAKSILFLLIPIFLLLLCDIIIPIKVFVYRPFEALIFAKISANSPFYPNESLKMNAVGDLCHHKENSIVKDEFWETDELGFRNDKYIKDADVLIIGDSFIAGSSLTQSNIISNEIMKLDTNLKVYNIAPSSISQFDRLLKLGKINKPKQIIFSTVERSVPEKIHYYNANDKVEKLKKLLFYKNLNAYLDFFVKVCPLNWIKARVSNSKGVGIKGVNDSKMYFLHSTAPIMHTQMDLISTKNTLVTYKKYCDSLHVKFVFMPMPDKETVYPELVPLVNQPKYLFQLDSSLRSSGIATINTLKIYNEYRKTNTNLLYHLDDTHWNSTATKIIATEIIKQIQTSKL